MSVSLPEGNAVVYCEGFFETTNGKTAHGLVRRTKRYNVVAVIDSRCAGRDAGDVLGEGTIGIPVVRDLSTAVESAARVGVAVTHFVVGLAPEGGRLSLRAREDVKAALALGLNVDSGLHDLLSEDREMAALASARGVRIRDVRKTPPAAEMHFFCGKIAEVDSLRIAVLGTDSAVGKRTTAWLLTDAFERAGYSAELIGTGQTAWLQGVQYGIVEDALVLDFVTGEIEHVVWTAWKERAPQVLIIEGQGSLMNPAYPGGIEILSAGRPDVVVLQHAPARREYDGFPGFPVHTLESQINAIESVSAARVGAVTISHENLSLTELETARTTIGRQTGLPALDVLLSGADGLVPHLAKYKCGVPSPIAARVRLDC